VRNAVIMGRKTWDSIPLKFRPLKGRVNIVLSRSHTTPKPLPEIDTDEEPLRVASLSDALKALEASNEIGKVFVIGGAEIYRMAIQEQATKRILVTNILSDFDCDTFFPISLPGDDGQWTKKGKEELDAWVGEDVAPGEQEENGIKYVFEMYERE
jgi:dihydrofolate reductase